MPDPNREEMAREAADGIGGGILDIVIEMIQDPRAQTKEDCAARMLAILIGGLLAFADAERERCARIAEDRAEPSWHPAAKSAATLIAAAIRGEQ